MTCILDCMAHLLRVPEEVENAFLNRTIKAFTWVRSEKAFSGISSNNCHFRFIVARLNLFFFVFDQMENDSEDGHKVYESMTAALRCVLEDMRFVEAEPATPFALT